MSGRPDLRPWAEDSPARRTNTQIVYEALKREILDGTLDPGQVISPSKTYQGHTVSRTPVREAIRMLQAEGLVEGEANRRVRVAPVSAEEVEQFYAIRIGLEAIAVGVAAPRMTDGDLAELEGLLGDMKRCIDMREYVAWEEPHRDFHRVLTRGAGDPIGRMCASLSESTTRYRSLFLRQEPVTYVQGEADHAAIFEACSARDPVLAGALLARHLARTAIFMVATIDPGRDPVAVRTAVNLIRDPPTDTHVLASGGRGRPRAASAPLSND